MFLKTIKFTIAIAALTMCCSAFAQDCNSCNNNYVGDQCGRGISQSQAAALWAGYCTESCGFSGGPLFNRDRGCGLLHRDRGCASNHCGEAVQSNACSGCDETDNCGRRGCSMFSGFKGKFNGMFAETGCGKQSCFGYKGGCNDECNNECGGGLLSHFSKRCGDCHPQTENCNDCDNGCGNDCGGGLFGSGGLLGNRVRGCSLFGSGCGCDDDPCDDACKLGGLRDKMRFSAIASKCGCRNSFFSGAIGPEYGNTGMQSCVSGCATNACN